MPMYRFLAALTLVCTTISVHAQRGQGPAPAAPPGGGRGQASPASVRPPQPATTQTYPRDQIEAGRGRFAAQCGFCHGRDAAGGDAANTDLTRSMLVTEDVRGDRLIPFLRTGRPDRGMPAFQLPDADLNAIVAFVHDQQVRAASVNGDRRAVSPEDLQTGNAAAGQRYFDANCTTCHAATGDLRGIASRLQGLTLLQRMLYPPLARGPGQALRPARATVTPKTGPPVSGTLVSRDEFTIALTDSAGWHRSWSTRQVTFTIDNPLQAHIDQLPKYTDKDMHDVLAYLQTLR